MGSHDANSYTVVVNDEGQHSIWDADLPVPSGWREIGFRGTRDACFDYIEEQWTDMRPITLGRGGEAI